MINFCPSPKKLNISHDVPAVQEYLDEVENQCII